MSTNRLIVLVVACASVLAMPGHGVAAPDRPRVTCRACFLIDDTGRVLFRRAANDELANASTTKMVTALLVRRTRGLEATVTISDNAAMTGEGGLDLQPGETYPVRDLLYALLLSSSNDAAVGLAEHVAGSEGAFVARMNRLVDDLGLRHTNFVTSHGLDRAGHYSSARDLARIAVAVLRDRQLADIVGTRAVKVRGQPSRIVNRNVLLKSYKGTVGVKTGFTDEAGEVLVAAAVRGDRRLIAVAMNSDDAAADATRVLDFGFSVLRRTVLVERGTVVGHLVFDPGGSVSVAVGRPLRGLATPETVDLEFKPDARVKLPVKEGQVVGSLTVAAGGETIRSADVMATESLGIEEASWVAGAFGGLLKMGNGLAGLLP